MDLRTKLGQLIVVGFGGAEVDDHLRKIVRERKAGNIILFSRNVTSLRQLRRLTRDITALVMAECGVPPIIQIDQEGGVVSRLSADGVNMPGAMALSATDDPENAFLAARAMGRQLRACGVSMNLAPCVDVNSNPANPVIGVRSFGAEPERVARFAVAYVRGLRVAGVLSCVKHFPGHGDTAVDSHLDLPVVDKPWEALLRTELPPFRAAMAAGVDCVMTTHILFPQVESGGLPATMSREILTNRLRGELGWRGLITTDCLEMQAIQKRFGTDVGAATAIAAGVDLADVSHTLALQEAALDRMREWVEAGKLPLSRVEDAVARVLAIKARLFGADAGGVGANPFLSEEAPDADALAEERALAARLYARSITRWGDEPVRPADADTVFIGPAYARGSQASSDDVDASLFPRDLAARFGAAWAESPIDPDAGDIARLSALARGKDVVVGLFEARLHAGQLALCDALARDAAHVTAVALRSPYDLGRLPEGVTRIAAYEYGAAAFDAVAEVIAGRVKASGVRVV